MKKSFACLVSGMLVLTVSAVEAKTQSPSNDAWQSPAFATVSPGMQMAEIGWQERKDVYDIEPAPVAAKEKVKIDLFAVIPDGTSLTFDEFRKRVGNDFASKFDKLKPNSVTRAGNHFVLSTDGTAHSKYGLTVYVAQSVTFTAVKDGEVLTATNIDGIDVQVGPKRLRLRQVVITPLPGNQARIEGKLEISASLPYLPISVTVDRNDVHH